MFHSFDWWIIAIFLTILAAAALYTKRYTKSVADFLVANRCGGRYLLTTACAMNFMGASTIIAQYQVHYDAGFTALWWNQLLIPVFMFVSLSGWVIYRWRATRVMTQSQFFELRYSKAYRISAGLIGFVTGVFGLGLMPAIGARFFMSFCGLPETFLVAGLNIPMYDFLMISLIVVTWFFTFTGGQIAVMVTDFLQGIVFLLVFLVILAFLVFKFPWQQIMDGVAFAPEGKSLIHPFRIENLDTYNITFFLWIAFGSLFLWPVHGMVQPTAGSAKTAHESHMAQILANVRHMTVYFALAMMPICAFVVMNHPDFSELAAKITYAIQSHASAFGDNADQVQREIQVPVALAHILPVGLLGFFAACVLAAFITSNDSYFLVFGGMFIQDIILPFRKKPFNPKTHMLLLRLAILGLGASMYFVGKYFLLKLDIQMFWALLVAIQAGAIMVPMLGGLYWKRCTTLAAWVSTVVGFVLPIVGYCLITTYDNFPLNGVQFAMAAVTLTWCIFAGISIIDGRNKPFNMDRLLHRGQYALDEEKVEDHQTGFWLYRLLKIDKEFTKRDKMIYFGIMALSIIGFIVFLIGTVWNMVSETGNKGWSLYWQIQVWSTLVIGSFVTVWLSIGGFKDLLQLFKDLKVVKRNALDDGRVEGYHNAGESIED